jgi:hypothetical protein
MNFWRRDVIEMGRVVQIVGYKRAREAGGIQYRNPRYLVFFSK